MDSIYSSIRSRGKLTRSPSTSAPALHRSPGFRQHEIHANLLENAKRGVGESTRSDRRKSIQWVGRALGWSARQLGDGVRGRRASIAPAPVSRRRRALMERRRRSCSSPLLRFDAIRIKVSVGRHLFDEPILEASDLRLQTVGCLAAEHPVLAMRHHQREGLDEAAGANLIDGKGPMVIAMPRPSMAAS